MENDNEQDAMKKGCTEEATPNPTLLTSTLASTIMPKRSSSTLNDNRKKIGLASLTGATQTLCHPH